MNIDALKNELEGLKYGKYKLLFLVGEKKKFVKLIAKLPPCESVSIRNLLLTAARERQLPELDGPTVKHMVTERLPVPVEGCVAVVELELLIKYDLISTLFRAQQYQQTTYLIHIPARYQNAVASEHSMPLG